MLPTDYFERHLANPSWLIEPSGSLPRADLAERILKVLDNGERLNLDNLAKKLFTKKSAVHTTLKILVAKGKVREVSNTARGRIEYAFVIRR